MAEKTSELNKSDQLDPLAVTAGAGRDPFVEKYVDGAYPDSGAEQREFDTNTGPHPEETEHLKAQIEETRSQMGETIDAIQEKLSFANISDQVQEHVSNAIETAKDTVYDATIGKAVYFMKNVGSQVTESKMGRTAMDNPFPLLLIGLGAGLLAYNSFSGSSRERRYSSERRRNLKAHYADSADRVREMGQERSTMAAARDTASEMADSVSTAVGSAYDGVSSKVGNVYHAAGDITQRAYNTAGEMTNRAYNAASEMTHTAKEKIGEVGTYTHQKYDQYMEQNPLAVGAVALAVGAAVGFAIPATRYEGELMGDARDNLLHMAQESANDFVGRAKQVAGEAGRAINEEVRSI